MRTRKVGGIRFIWIGRLTISFCWRKARRPMSMFERCSSKPRRPRKSYPLACVFCPRRVEV